MRYLVTGETVDPPAPAQPEPEEGAKLIERVVIPSLEMLEASEREGRVLAGGILAGRRGAAMVIEAGSHDEVTELLAQLPVWPTARWEVTPLQTFADRKEHDLRVVERLRELAGGGG